MIIGVPKELKESEHRVALTPSGATYLTDHGHTVVVEQGAGQDSGFGDDAYAGAGASLVEEHQDVFARAELIVKVKEPLDQELDLLHQDQILFGYLHLAANKVLTQKLLHAGSVAIAYEMVQNKDGMLPLLAPMSEMAGRIAPLMAAYHLSTHSGGAGKFIAGIPGVLPATVMIIGGGVVGTNAAKMASGLGANTTVLDTNLARLRYLDDIMPSNVRTLASNQSVIQQLLPTVDILIGSVLVPGAKAPHVVSREMISLLQNGSAVVDVAVDQGGCIETTHPTTHRYPTFEFDGVIHYCVTNIPGAYPRTSTLGLTNATFPYVVEIAEQGWCEAIRNNHALAHGVNLVKGVLTCAEVADAHQLPFCALEEVTDLTHSS